MELTKSSAASSSSAHQIEILLEDMPANEKVEYMIRTKLMKISDSCPDNAFIQAKIKDLGSRVSAEILVKHVMGQFLAYCEEKTLGESVNEAVSQMSDQIKEWRETRSVSISQLDAGLKVLIVDDDPISVKFIETALVQRGCETNVVDNGQAAVDEMFEHQYDLVVLDWNMPSMNGMQTLKMLDETADLSKTGIQNKNVPILIYSGTPRTDIEFPKSKSFRKIGYLQKTHNYDSIRETTDLLLESLKKNKEKDLMN
ncbi:MAG: response regulator [Proteobacteria bacterium]|nr:MAG: response regulator [Pseudomonadota bacterium]